jgi:hypothetical protein
MVELYHHLELPSKWKNRRGRLRKITHCITLLIRQTRRQIVAIVIVTVRTSKTPEWPEIELLMAEGLAFNNFEQIFGDCTNTNNMFYNNHTMSHFQ